MSSNTPRPTEDNPNANWPNENPSVITITINTANDAFQHNRGPQETARILRQLADQIVTRVISKNDRIPLMDTNGNTVGVCTTSKD